MILISHRGNLDGKKEELENNPGYIDAALYSGFDVEIDVWYDKGWWLGHDEPQYKTNIEYLTNNRFWIHCKNIDALCLIGNTRLNYFWHDADDYTLTSHGYIWAYPDKQVLYNSNTIAVLPELNNTDVTTFSGVCSDVIGNYETRPL